MESHLVSAVASQTGLGMQDSHSLLQSKGWDLSAALTAYENAKNTVNLDMMKSLTRLQPDWPIPVAASLNHAPTNMAPPLRAGLEERRDSKPALLKAEAVDLIDCKKLARGISRATDNVTLVSRARTEIAMDFPGYTVNKQYYIETPEYTFTLPDITVYTEDFRKFLEKDLIDNSCLVALEQSGRLNWWSVNGACQRLWPLATTGDGNCLLHAASLAMWGFHDRLLTLRGALHGLLANGSCKDALWRRWRWQQTKLNAEAGFVYSENEWAKEWEGIVSMASIEPRKPCRRISFMERNIDDVDGNKFENATYESLEEIHVLALAHVLRRPIIVIADVMLKDLNGEAMAPIPFGGIYLPLENPPSECHRSPLLLTYDMAHFSALVVMEKETFGDKTVMIPPAVIPLTDPAHCLLPIQFTIDPGEEFRWGVDDKDQNVINKLVLAERDQMGLLKEYLDVVYVSSQMSPGEEYEIDFSEDEIDKKFTEPDVLSYEDTSEQGMFNNKSKAAKQLQSVAKQFGSIGKSMSKKIKKNIGSITKIGAKGQTKKSNMTSGSSSSSFTKSRLLCAILRAKRHEYQEEMIRNYLDFAQERFLKSESDKTKQETERQHFENLKLQEQAMLEGPLNCVNPGCDQYGTALTSYMCPECFEKQRIDEICSKNEDLSPRYDTGNSKFYAETDIQAHESIKRLPSVRALNHMDQTLYLSRSTFYNDTKCPTANGEVYKPGCSPVLGNAARTKEMQVKSLNNGQDDETKTEPENSYNRNNALQVYLPGQVSVFSPGNTITAPQSYNLAKVNSRTQKPEIISRDVHSAIVSINQQSSTDLITLEPRPQTTHIPVKATNAELCRTKDCIFFGSADMDYYCSKCCRERKVKSSF